jgi:hypothetical protein
MDRGFLSYLTLKLHDSHRLMKAPPFEKDNTYVCRCHKSGSNPSMPFLLPGSSPGQALDRSFARRFLPPLWRVFLRRLHRDSALLSRRSFQRRRLPPACTYVAKPYRVRQVMAMITAYALTAKEVRLPEPASYFQSLRGFRKPGADYHFELSSDQAAWLMLMNS